MLIQPTLLNALLRMLNRARALVPFIFTQDRISTETDEDT